METRDEKGRVARAVVAYASARASTASPWSPATSRRARIASSRISYYTAERAWRETKGVNMLPARPLRFHRAGALGEGAAPVPAMPHDVVPRRAADPDGPRRPRVGRPRDRLRAVPRARAQPREGRRGRLRGSGHRRRKDSPPRRLLRPCNECHASSGAVEPSDPEFTRVQGTTLMFSRCFTATGGAIHCATCHDPHRGLDTTTAHYEPKCLACHDAKAAPARQARPADLPRQPVLGLHRLPHAQGAGPEPQDAVHRPPHPRPSPARGGPGRRRMTT